MRRALMLALTGVLIALSASANDDATMNVEDKVQDVLGWHTVKPGENFQTITRHYLGTASLWFENVKLNPQLENPGLLRAGQRLRVIIERQLPARRAMIEEISNDVHKNPQDAGWQDARRGDELAPRDGVRTREQSSSRLGFDDGSRLVMSELTQIFLKDLETSVTGVKRGSIEVRNGQAELHLDAPQPRLVDIEIVVGESVVKPRPGPAGTGQTRSRRPDRGGAQLMVYGGSSSIEAGGAAVEVPRGMGTSVPEGGTPAPPEKLLPAPRTTRPGSGSSFSYSNPRFVWQAVNGAASYVVEICADGACEKLVRRATDLTTPSWQPEALPVADLFWRVSAVSASGLDGYASRARSLAVTSEVPDLQPPAVVAAILGNGHHTEDGSLVLGDGAAIHLEGRDDASGVAAIRYRWDEGPWQVWKDRPLTVASGERTLEVVIVDQLEQAADPWSMVVRRDDTTPLAPTVHRADR